MKKYTNIPDSIKPGFNSMETINAFASQFKKVSIKDNILKAFNRKHKTTYESWDDVSKDVDNLTKEMVVDNHAMLNWYLMYKTNKATVDNLVSSMSKKEQRIVKEHTLQSFLF